MHKDVFLTWPELAVICAATLFLSACGTYLLTKFLPKFGMIDKPNKRSNHKKAVPRGGGIAVIGVFIAAFLAISLLGDVFNFLWMVLISTVLLMFVSWIDDIKPLSPILRLVAQILAIWLVLMHPHNPLFGGFFPMWLDTLLIGLLWLWFINLYNFMDGIDGITCSETITICIGMVLIAFFSQFPQEVAVFALALAICCAGFLPWNWHKAKIFLGDVGSIPLGFLVGWLLIVLAMYGYWAAALILPAYYFTDAGITLLMRLIRKKKIWQAHSEHFYQQAVRSGKSHSAVVITITVANIGFTGLAVASTISQNYAVICFAAAIILSLALLYYLKPKKS